MNEAGSIRTPVSWRQQALWAAVLVAVTLTVVPMRRAMIRGWFVDGPPGPPPAMARLDGEEGGMAPVARTRVILLDGLGRAYATLPALDRLCGAGLDLVVDTGFPTVSLPVQTALWTGRTQVQSGIMYRIPQLEVVPVGALPTRVDSVAVAESHPGIVHSFGFADTRPRADEVAASVEGRGHGAGGWDEVAFLGAAQAAVASDKALAFVHVLRIDEAGHRTGARSVEYAAAARWADELLGRLTEAATPSHTTRWFILADHGHRPGGGHGGAEPAIRMVRGCIVGGRLPGAAPAPGPDGTVHLVDMARALADSTGQPAAEGGVGRPLTFALQNPEAFATVPHPGQARWIAAALIVLLVLILAIVLTGRRWWALPFWLPLAHGSVLLLRGLPTLSHPMVYPPLGRDMVVAAAPGLVALAGVAWWWSRRAPLSRLVATQLVPAAGAAAAAAVLCGALQRALLGDVRPALMPVWTAHTSLFLVLLAAGAIVVAMVLAVRLVLTLRTMRARRRRG